MDDLSGKPHLHQCLRRLPICVILSQSHCSVCRRVLHRQSYSCLLPEPISMPLIFADSACRVSALADRRAAISCRVLQIMALSPRSCTVLSVGVVELGLANLPTVVGRRSRDKSRSQSLFFEDLHTDGRDNEAVFMVLLSVLRLTWANKLRTASRMRSFLTDALLDGKGPENLRSRCTSSPF
jgi:hypothetical protein